MGLFGPEWWHHHGIKMRLKSIDHQQKQLVISGSAATVIIRKAPSVNPQTKEGWFVDWEVEHYVPYGIKAQGRCHFTDEDLGIAFGLMVSPIPDERIVDQYGIVSFRQGKYIRLNNFLNIPCPGTGHDGDPNVSIELDEEIREAILKLLHE